MTTTEELKHSENTWSVPISVNILLNKVVKTESRYCRWFQRQVKLAGQNRLRVLINDLRERHLMAQHLGVRYEEIRYSISFLGTWKCFLIGNRRVTIHYKTRKILKDDG